MSRRIHHCDRNEARQDGDPLRLYPDLEPLRGALAVFHRVRKEELLIVPGGADTGIDVPMRTLPPGSLIARPDPCFPRYSHWIGLNRHREIVVPIRKQGSTWVVDADELIAAGRQADAIIIDPSGNPTGARISRDTIERLRAEVECTVILDCVYEEHLGEQFITRAITMPATIALGSFSKSFGLAGLRIGYIVGSAAALAPLRPFEAAFGISTLQINRAVEALKGA